MKNSWSVNDGFSFKAYVVLNEKEVTLATFEFGNTEILGVWNFQQFLDSNGSSEIVKYLGKKTHDEILETVKEKIQNKK